MSCAHNLNLTTNSSLSNLKTKSIPNGLIQRPSRNLEGPIPVHTQLFHHIKIPTLHKLNLTTLSSYTTLKSKSGPYGRPPPINLSSPHNLNLTTHSSYTTSKSKSGPHCRPPPINLSCAHNLNLTTLLSYTILKSNLVLVVSPNDPLGSERVQFQSLHNYFIMSTYSLCTT